MEFDLEYGIDVFPQGTSHAYYLKVDGQMLVASANAPDVRAAIRGRMESLGLRTRVSAMVNVCRLAQEFGRWRGNEEDLKA